MSVRIKSKIIKEAYKRRHDDEIERYIQKERAGYELSSKQCHLFDNNREGEPTHENKKDPQGE